MYGMNHAEFPSHLDSCSGCPSDGWPDNGRHHQIAILQRDGLYQLERGGSIGDGGDPRRSEGGGGGRREKIEGRDDDYEDEDRRRRAVARFGRGGDRGHLTLTHISTGPYATSSFEWRTIPGRRTAMWWIVLSAPITAE